MTFNEFNFHKDIQKGIKIAGFKQPSPIQEEAIPIVLERTDLVAQAHTGTGKTAAFGLPIMDMIAQELLIRAHAREGRRQEKMGIETRQY